MTYRRKLEKIQKQNRKSRFVHAYVMTGRIIAVYIHRMLVGFNSHALPTICLHCNNAAVALRAIRVM